MHPQLEYLLHTPFIFPTHASSRCMRDVHIDLANQHHLLPTGLAMHEEKRRDHVDNDDPLNGSPLQPASPSVTCQTLAWSLKD